MLSIGLRQLIHRSFSFDFETEKCRSITMANYSYYSSTEDIGKNGFSQYTGAYTSTLVAG